MLKYNEFITESIGDISLEEIENKKIFGSTFYEFDSLGTTMFTELSAAIEKLWVKDASKKN